MRKTEGGEWITTGEVAKMWGVTIQTVRNWIYRGEIPAKDVSGGDRNNRWLVRRVDAEKRMEES